MKTTKRQRGFTLIEVLVGVAIVGILAGIAVPMYASYVANGRRAEGKAALLANAGAEERYYTMNNTYAATLSDAGAKAFSGDNATTSSYTISISPGASGIGSGYTMTATPNFSDPVCGNLSITQSGAKSFSGAGGTSAKCW